MSALARLSDPAPSHEAARAVEATLPENLERILAVICAIDACNGGRGATAHEVRCHLVTVDGRAPDQNVVASRCSQLKGAGRVSDLGVKRMGGKGVRITAWLPVQPDGQGVLL